jgi:PAS domain S-box-containing protein
MSERVPMLLEQFEIDELTGELLLQLLDGMPDALIIANRKGRILLINKLAELLFQYHRSELVGRDVEVLIPEALRTRHVEERTMYVREPRVRRMGEGRPLFAINKQGEEVALEISLGPVVTRSGLLICVGFRVRRENDLPR